MPYALAIGATLLDYSFQPPFGGGAMGSFSLMHWLVVMARILISVRRPGILPRVMVDSPRAHGFQWHVKEEEDPRPRLSRRQCSSGRHRLVCAPPAWSYRTLASRQDCPSASSSARCGVAHAASCRSLTISSRSAPSPGGPRGKFSVPGRNRAGSVIEAAPVIILPAAECPHSIRIVIYDYYFLLGRRPRRGSRLAESGPRYRLCNHSNRPRAGRSQPCPAHLELSASTSIAPGESGDDRLRCVLWFRPR